MLGESEAPLALFLSGDNGRIFRVYRCDRHFLRSERRLDPDNHRIACPLWHGGARLVARNICECGKSDTDAGLRLGERSAHSSQTPNRGCRNRISSATLGTRCRIVRLQRIRTLSNRRVFR